MAIAVVDSELVELVRFQLPGKPPNWSNQRGHWATLYVAQREWREKTIILALEARAKARLPAPKGWRQVEVVFFYAARPFDDDGKGTAAKPVVDGLKGNLILDDKPELCQIVVRQEKVRRMKEQRTEVIVRERRPAA